MAHGRRSTPWARRFGWSVADGPPVIQLTTDELSTDQVGQLRTLLWAAFADDEHGGFDETDWQHAQGGIHFVTQADGVIVGHAAVVQRNLHVAGRRLHTGYVEAVATVPELHGHGHGTAIMCAVNELIGADYELGALGTGKQGFYERLGWQVWHGPSAVRRADNELPTPDDDGYIMVRLTTHTPAIDTSDLISCEWRPGDVW